MSDPQTLQPSLSPYDNPYAAPNADVGGVAPTATDHSTLADPGSRLVAKIVDNLSLMAVLLPGFLVMVSMVSVDEDLALLGGALGVLLGLVAWCGWTLKLLAENGQTIGKRMLGVKIVNDDGSPVPVGKVVFIRFAATQLLVSFIPFFGLIDVLFIFRADRRCIHDMMASTKVVKA